MNRAKIIIGENYRSIGPEEVARRLCLGYSNFRRIFKEYTGLSQAKYIQQVRMGKVKFFTAFRRLTGMTPLEYRAFTQGK